MYKNSPFLSFKPSFGGLVAVTTEETTKEMRKIIRQFFTPVIWQCAFVFIHVLLKHTYISR